MQGVTADTDIYKGIHLRVQAEVSTEEFELYVAGLLLREELSAVWVYLNTRQLALLDVLTNRMHFAIHHALGSEIVVYRWIAKAEDLVVPYSLFWVAAGALVIHEGKVLLVQEKSGRRKDKFGLPGGRANPQELVAQCAERELLEETGIKAKFSRVILIRELGKGQIYNCVDIYFVCLMELQEGGLEQFHLCQQEIASHAWVPLEEYEEFSSKHSMGTQIMVSKHVSKLHKEGKLFSTSQYHNELSLPKGLCEHRL